jgi:hypothetical protein
MCRQHLLGEHVELHMLLGCLKRGYSIEGYVEQGLVSTAQIASRHKDLVAEMKRRGYRHKSPLRVNAPIPTLGRVDATANLAELAKRCAACRKMQRQGL